MKSICRFLEVCVVPSAERVDDVELSLLGRVDEKAVPLRDVHLEIHRQIVAVQHHLHKHLGIIARREEEIVSSDLCALYPRKRKGGEGRDITREKGGRECEPT